MTTKITELAAKIEGQLKLYDGLGGDFRFVMNPDAAKAFVEQLRVTEKLVAAYEQMRIALIEARAALATLDHMNGKEDGLAVFRNGKPIKTIIDAALGVGG